MRPRPSVILDTLLHGILRTALLFSLFLLFAGHNAPGGGFVGGLVAAASLLLLYAAGGVEGVDDVLPVREGTLLGLGVIAAGGVGLGGYLWDGHFLGSVKLEFEVGVLGTFKATSALPFDIGVYLVVVGLALAVLRALGGDDPVVPAEPETGGVA